MESREKKGKPVEGTHRSVDSCTSSAAWKNPSFCHCSSPPGAAMLAATRTTDQTKKRAAPDAKSSCVFSGLSSLLPDSGRVESRTLAGEISRTDREKDCATHGIGKATIADYARVSSGGAALVASRRGSGRREGRRGREREVNYSSQLVFSFVVLFGFASSFWCLRISVSSFFPTSSAFFLPLCYFLFLFFILLLNKYRLTQYYYYHVLFLRWSRVFRDYDFLSGSLFRSCFHRAKRDAASQAVGSRANGRD